MKIKEGYILDTIGDQKIAVSVDYSDDKFCGMVKLNAVGAFLWEKLLQDTTEDALVQAVTEAYQIDAETAKIDIGAFITQLKENGVLEYVL